MAGSDYRFAEAICSLRRQKGKSLREAAADSGISFTYLSRIERGDFPPPSAECIKRIASNVGIDSDLLCKAVGKPLQHSPTEWVSVVVLIAQPLIASKTQAQLSLIEAELVDIGSFTEGI